MKTREYSACITNAGIAHLLTNTDAGSIKWIAHPNFKGVYMKHLIIGDDTDGRFSSHIVKVDPGFALENHAHDSQWELHEVVDGNGTCMLEQKEITYNPGRMTIIPAGVVHRVDAGESGLFILSKFFPALV